MERNVIRTIKAYVCIELENGVVTDHQVITTFSSFQCFFINLLEPRSRINPHSIIELNYITNLTESVLDLAFNIIKDTDKPYIEIGGYQVYRDELETLS